MQHFLLKSQQKTDNKICTRYPSINLQRDKAKGRNHGGLRGRAVCKLHHFQLSSFSIQITPNGCLSLPSHEIIKNKAFCWQRSVKVWENHNQVLPIVTAAREEVKLSYLETIRSLCWLWVDYGKKLWVGRDNNSDDVNVRTKPKNLKHMARQGCKCNQRILA